MPLPLKTLTLLQPPTILKVTKSLDNTMSHQTPLHKPDGTWARTDSEREQLFANYLKNIFFPNPPEPSYD